MVKSRNSASSKMTYRSGGTAYLLTAEQAEELERIDRELELMHRFRGQLADNVRSVVNGPGMLTREEYREEFEQTGSEFQDELYDEMAEEIAAIRDVVDFAGRDRRNTEANIKILEERKRKILQNARRL